MQRIVQGSGRASVYEHALDPGGPVRKRLHPGEGGRLLTWPYAGFGSLPGRDPHHPGGGFVPPGTTYFCRQAKVGKNWLRGVAPKDPKFLEQGRGGVYFANGIGRVSTYEPWQSP